MPLPWQNLTPHAFSSNPLALRSCVEHTRKKIPNLPFFDIFRPCIVIPPYLKSAFFCALRIANLRSSGNPPFHLLDGLTNFPNFPITPPTNQFWPRHQVFADKLVEFGMPHARIVQHGGQSAPGPVIVGQGLDNAWLRPLRGGYESSGHVETSGSVHRVGLSVNYPPSRCISV